MPYRVGAKGGQARPVSASHPAEVVLRDATAAHAAVSPRPRYLQHRQQGYTVQKDALVGMRWRSSKGISRATLAKSLIKIKPADLQALTIDWRSAAALSDRIPAVP
jgi:hypothetical protein